MSLRFDFFSPEIVYPFHPYLNRVTVSLPAFSHMMVACVLKFSLSLSFSFSFSLARMSIIVGLTLRCGFSAFLPRPQKGDYVRVLRTDEADDNFFGEVFGKSGYFPNYYAGKSRDDTLFSIILWA